MCAASDVRYGELTVTIDRDQIAKALRFCATTARCRFEVLIDICGVDYPERAERFDVVYHLLSPRLNQRIRVKLSTDDDDAGSERGRRFLPPPTGSSAKPTTCTEFCFRAIRICAVS